MPPNTNNGLSHANIMSLLIGLAVLTAVGFLVVFYKLDLETRGIRTDVRGVLSGQHAQMMEGDKLFGMMEEKNTPSPAKTGEMMGGTEERMRIVKTANFGERITLQKGDAYSIYGFGDTPRTLVSKVELLDITDSRCKIDGTDCSAQGEINVALKVTDLQNNREQLVMLGTKSATCAETIGDGFELGNVDTAKGEVTLHTVHSCQ